MKESQLAQHQRQGAKKHPAPVEPPPEKHSCSKQYIGNILRKQLYGWRSSFKPYGNKICDYKKQAIDSQGYQSFCSFIHFIYPHSRFSLLQGAYSIDTTPYIPILPAFLYRLLRTSLWICFQTNHSDSFEV